MLGDRGWALHNFVASVMNKPYAFKNWLAGVTQGIVWNVFGKDWQAACLNDDPDDCQSDADWIM